jgi:uncharacterized membrane protein
VWVAGFLVAGFVLLFLLLLSTQKAGKRAAARVSVIFIVIWLLVAAGYVWYGVAQSSESVLSQLPAALLIFLPPALPAAVVWTKNRRA